MPEISEQDYRQFMRYQNIGSPDEVTKKIDDLTRDNGKQRDEIRDLQQKVPKEGTAVVPQADAEELEKYRALGKPDDLTAAVGERDTLKAEAAERTRKDTLREAGRAAFGNDTAGDVLDSVKGSEGWVVSFQEEGDGDAKKRVPYVTTGEGQQPVKLEKFAEEKFGHLLPALKSTQTATAATTGTPFVRQAPTGAPTGGPRTEDEFRRATEQTASYTL